ncbi:hypothetical protein AXF14_08550 [Actinomyces radicidentis]|uniref:Uncharacterized protein n=1 Tax=Actinomyces radicidentis TaxID=111015 RepID=A0A0X8JFE5_ACTRD|nr:hypothetical protein [Actinomyces radicidentis]AMD87626.1 hypothetical protein AXF14_08550 [Actinomyces radicidentis]
MKKTVATLAALGALVVGPVLATPAQAATGGEVTDDPGVVALLDAQGEHRCSAVLVAKDWALAWSDSTRCAAATGAVATNGRTASVDDHRYFQQRDGVTHTDPSKSQAMLVHLDHPLEGVATARLSDRAPQAGPARGSASSPSTAPRTPRPRPSAAPTSPLTATTAGSAGSTALRA